MKLPARMRVPEALPGIVGTARVERRTRALLARLRPGDLAVLDHVDMDRSTAQALLDAGVVAVVNASPMISGRYPNLGPEVLARATRRFSRAPEARARPGAGLGLALVEHLVVRAGGELRLCHAGRHTSTGVATGPACGHDDRMTVTVLLPVAHPG